VDLNALHAPNGQLIAVIPLGLCAVAGCILRSGSQSVHLQQEGSTKRHLFLKVVQALNLEPPKQMLRHVSSHVIGVVVEGATDCQSWWMRR
jgi:hypothetical protein